MSGRCSGPNRQLIHYRRLFFRAANSECPLPLIDPVRWAALTLPIGRADTGDGARVCANCRLIARPLAAEDSVNGLSSHCGECITYATCPHRCPKSNVQSI